MALLSHRSCCPARMRMSQPAAARRPFGPCSVRPAVARAHAAAAAVKAPDASAGIEPLPVAAAAGATAAEQGPSRRSALVAAAAVLMGAAAPPTLSPGAAYAEAEVAAPAAALEQFTNAKQGYVVSVPSGWDRIDKAGADVLFEDPSRRSTSLGVTVNPVRIPDITGFGTLQAVGERLLVAERKKESTMSATMVSQSERRAAAPQTNGEALLYDFEYDLDSTRGRKRILNTVTIYRSKLYILNAQYKCEKSDEGCSSEQATQTIGTLRELAASFSVL